MFSRGKFLHHRRNALLNDYGCTNEINAIATFVGKFIPVLLPTLTFRCSKFPIGHHYGVVNGDGSCIEN